MKNKLLELFDRSFSEYEVEALLNNCSFDELMEIYKDFKNSLEERRETNRVSRFSKDKKEESIRNLNKERTILFDRILKLENPEQINELKKDIQTINEQIEIQQSLIFITEVDGNIDNCWTDGCSADSSLIDKLAFITKIIKSQMQKVLYNNKEQH